MCALCVSVLLHSRTSALSHLANTALPTPVRNHTGSHWCTAPCVPRCTISASCVVPHCLVLCTTLHFVCLAALLFRAGGRGQCNALPGRLEAVSNGTPASHCRIAWGQWAVELLPYTASLPWGSGPCISCIALPHRLEAVGIAYSRNSLTRRRGAVGSGTPVQHRLCARVRWAVELPLLVLCTVSLPWGSGRWKSCNSLPQCLGAVGSRTPATHRLTTWGQWGAELLQRTASLPGGSGQWDPCNAPPRCLGALGSGTPATHSLSVSGQWAMELLYTPPLCRGAVGSGILATHCLTAWGQWAVGLLQRTASLPGGGGQRNSCNALPHCLGAMGSGTPATHGLSASGQWAMELLYTPPLCRGAVGSGILATHCLTAWGHWAVGLLQRTASLPGGSGQRNSCNALPHCPGAVGSGTPAMHCLTAWGHWAVELLQRTASLSRGSGQ